MSFLHESQLLVDQATDLIDLFVEDLLQVVILRRVYKQALEADTVLAGILA